MKKEAEEAEWRRHRYHDSSLCVTALLILSVLVSPAKNVLTPQPLFDEKFFFYSKTQMGFHFLQKVFLECSALDTIHSFCFPAKFTPWLILVVNLAHT